MRSFFVSIVLLITIPLASQNTSLLSNFYSDENIKLIAPNIISTNLGEYSPFFDINHNELYFMRRTPGKFDYTIHKSKLTVKGWSVPTVVSFSGTYRDAAPYISPDGKTIFFDSKRPSTKVAENSINIWYAKRKGNEWSHPTLLVEASKNPTDESKAGQDEFGPAVDGKGNVYFYSFRNPYRGGAHYQVIAPDYKSINIRKEFPDPSARTFVSYTYISPNGRFLLLEGRAKNRNDTDIFYSCKTQSGTWTKPLGVEKINTTYGEGGPSMTADGQFLLFTSNRNTNQNSSSNANLHIVETKNLFNKCQKSFYE